MAAFLQKLFKPRKNEAPKPPARVPKTEPPKQNPQDERREQQLAQLASDPDAARLEELAISGVTADIRLQAAEQLSHPEALQRVQKAARSRDKGVYQVVRQKLTVIREAEQQEQQLQTTIETLIGNARDQAATEDTKLYEARLDALRQHWSDVEAKATPEQATAFLDAVNKCRTRVQELKAAADQIREQEEKASQRKDTLALLKQTLDDLHNQPVDPLPSLSALDALQKTQENRWLEATRDCTVAAPEQKAYQTLMQELRAYIKALRSLLQHKDGIASLLAAEPETGANELKSQIGEARKLLEEIHWPGGYPIPPMIKALTGLAGKKAARPAGESATRDQSGLISELGATLKKLDDALESRQLKESRQLHKIAQQQLKELDSRNSKPFQARMQLLGGQLRDLADWQGFATQPKQVALCEQMEYLATQPMEPETKANHIKDLQNEWRDLGGSSDRTLWARFKQASDAAYEPCREYFSAKSSLKHTNLEKRESICRELQVFVDQADWAAMDWKAAERIHRAAREEWRLAWPVEFRDNRQVQKQFDQLLRQIEDPLNSERKRNEALKAEVVARAEALATHEPLNDAINQAKALQEEWTAIGITRHREDRKLWQAFRKACDAIFSRRDAQRSEQEQQTREADQALQELLDEAGTLTPESPETAIRELIARLASSKEIPVSRAMRDQRTESEQFLRSLLEQQQKVALLTLWKTLIKNRMDGVLTADEVPADWPGRAVKLQELITEDLVIRAEIQGGIPSPQAFQARRMELQVQRLADGLGNQGGHQEDEVLESLIAAWCLNPDRSDVTEDQAQRLTLAVESATRL